MVQKKKKRPLFHSTAASQATDVRRVAFIYLISFYFPHAAPPCTICRLTRSTDDLSRPTL